MLVRNNQINLVLWGSRAIDFDVEGVYSVGQESTVVAIFVGMLLKSYKGVDTLSGGSACKWYINEEIPEIEKFFDRMLDAHYKVEWIPAGEQSFRALEQHKSLEVKTILELRDMDPWDFEASGYKCTVTISRVNNKQPWWFSSCTKCHRASTPSGTQYKCSGGCPCTTAEPKYRLSLVGTDGTGTAEFTLFGRVARQTIPCRKTLFLEDGCDEKKHKNILDKLADSKIMAPEGKNVVSHNFLHVVLAMHFKFGILYCTVLHCFIAPFRLTVLETHESIASQLQVMIMNLLVCMTASMVKVARLLQALPSSHQVVAGTKKQLKDKASRTLCPAGDLNEMLYTDIGTSPASTSFEPLFLFS